MVDSTSSYATRLCLVFGLENRNTNVVLVTETVAQVMIETWISEPPIGHTYHLITPQPILVLELTAPNLARQEVIICCELQASVYDTEMASHSRRGPILGLPKDSMEEALATRLRGLELSQSPSCCKHYLRIARMKLPRQSPL